MVVGCTYLVTYLNLLTLGYTLKEYFDFVIGRIECLFSIIGFIIITITIFEKGGIKNDIHL